MGLGQAIAVNIIGDEAVGRAWSTKRRPEKDGSAASSVRLSLQRLAEDADSSHMSFSMSVSALTFETLDFRGSRGPHRVQFGLLTV